MEGKGKSARRINDEGNDFLADSGSSVEKRHKGTKSLSPKGLEGSVWGEKKRIRWLKRKRKKGPKWRPGQDCAC